MSTSAYSSLPTTHTYQARKQIIDMVCYGAGVRDTVRTLKVDINAGISE
ncbi:IS1-like element transposase [Pectobacterium carotovorum]|nr:hypothetical protein [Pectobacterium carotovorum]